MSNYKGVHSKGIGRGVIFTAAVTLSACLLLASTSLAQETIVQKYGQLSIKNNQIVDKGGNPVILRGMSLYASQSQGQFYNADVVKWLRDDWNCTIVRVPIVVQSTSSATNVEREKGRVRAIVQAAIDQGIYVIIDWQDRNAERTAPQAVAFFEEMAKTYGKYPNVIYELWGDPPNTQDWSTVIKPYHQALITKIRAFDADNIIVCGTQNSSKDVDKAAQDPLKLANVAYALHFHAAADKQPLRDKAAAALKSGIALVVTEWGTSEPGGAGKMDTEETKKWMEFIDKNRLSWCNWAIADLSEASAALKPGAGAMGGWKADMISPSGALVKAELLAKNPQMEEELKEIRTPDVIFVPTPEEVIDKMLELAKVTKNDLLYDPGCGDGRIVVRAALKIGCRCVGFDIDPQRVREARKRVQENNVGSLVRIEQRDIFTVDLSAANVITLYLLPSLNVKLIPQLEKLKPGSRIVSHDFDMKGCKPDQVVEMKGSEGYRAHTVYLWTIPFTKE